MNLEDRLRMYGMLCKLAEWGGLTTGSRLSNAGARGASSREQSERAQQDKLLSAGKWLIPAALGTVAAPFVAGYGVHRLGAKPSTTLKAGLGTAAVAPLVAMSTAPSGTRKSLFGL